MLKTKSKKTTEIQKRCRMNLENNRLWPVTPEEGGELINDT